MKSYKGILFTCLYLAVVLAPLCFVTLFIPSPRAGFLVQLGRAFALIGIMIIAMQAVLSARLKWIERHFGFDMLIRYHEYMVIFGAALLAAHPILLAAGGYGAGLVLSLKAPWYVWAGKAALIIVLANVGLSVYRPAVKLRYDIWRIAHSLAAASLFCLVFIHSFFAGRDINGSVVMRALWLFLPVSAMFLFIYHRLVRPYILGKKPYTVTEVKQAAGRIWNIRMEPPAGAEVPKYSPGQFQFITFRSKGLPVEEHHWTISSSPADEGVTASTIKELGDFTSLIGSVKPGDKAVIQMPFGKYSYIFNDNKKGCVFLAGGIGITPAMSMIRHMRDSATAMDVLLMTGNTAENDIPFGKELGEIAAEKHPALKVVHVLSRPEPGWGGEKGHVDKGMILKYLGNSVQERFFYVSGPGPFVRAAVKAAKEAGVRDDMIDSEIFSLTD